MNQSVMKITQNEAYEISMKVQAGVKLAKKQARAKEAKREGSTHPYNGLVSVMLVAAEEAIENMLAKAKATRGNPMIGLLAIEESKLDIRTLCAIGARTAVDGISAGHRLQTITDRMGSRIEDEIRMREFQKREPSLWKWMQERYKERLGADYEHKRRVLMGALRRANSEEIWKTWDTSTRAHVGLVIISALVDAGFLEKSRRESARKGHHYTVVQLTQECEEALGRAEERAQEMLVPWYKPMLEIPGDWSTPEDGGYVTSQMPIMKTHKREDMERLRAANMPVVYAAVNSLQRTPWRINEDVLVVAQEMRKREIALHGLPVLSEHTRPIRPPSLPPVGTQLTPEDKEVLTEFKQQRKLWFAEEAQRKSKTTQALQILEIARELKDEERFYFPHQIDYRGRAYAVPLQLNPQGNDLAKGLLTFAEGRPLGPMGAYWLAVHVANTWGVDKGPLNDRVDWVLDNQDEILASAADPITHLWWTQADGGKTVWQFLAACFEWANYVRGGLGPDFMSNLQVSVDGSCNGLQHFSAMLRDPVGALATNLTNSKEQHDIYTEVAEQTRTLVRASRHTSAVNTEMAGKWMEYGITRACVKRPVMTTPYGCSALGMKEMILGDTLLAGDFSLFKPKPWEAAAWLANKVDEAIGVTVSAAKEAMAALQNWAQVTAKNETPIAWTTPAGLPVVQNIQMSRSVLVATKLLGRIQLRYAEGIPKLDKRRQRSAITPNFVHSYDAAHLMLTVVEAEKTFGRSLSWAMVHDSYGTHAGDMEALGKILRKTFLAMYQDSDPLGDLRDSVVHSVPFGTEVAPAPACGDFDLNEVLEAEFFFA